MGAAAYVLINSEPSLTQEVFERLTTIPNGKARQVTGPYDIVLVLEVESPEYIGKILRERVRPIRGVSNTVTCMWLDQ